MTKLDAELLRWRDTPFGHGQATPKVGVDCLQLVAAVIQSLEGLPVQLAPTAPLDSAMHAASFAAESVTWAEDELGLELQTDYTDVPDFLTFSVKAGDVLATTFIGSNSKRMTHACIVDSDLERVWHVISSTGVCTSSVEYMRQWTLAIYRHPNHLDWQDPA